MALTAKPIKLTDGGGLFLLVQPNGAKYWRLAYRFAGKQKTLEKPARLARFCNASGKALKVFSNQPANASVKESKAIRHPSIKSFFLRFLMKPGECSPWADHCVAGVGPFHLGSTTSP